MNARKSLGPTLFLLSAFALISPTTFAGDRDQETLFTFNRPVRIPGAVLTPGAYWFVLVGNDYRTVEILNADRTKAIEMIETMPAERAEAKITSKTVLTFAEPHRRNSNNPPALVKWFYPGHLEGHEFVYSSHREKQVNREEHLTVYVSES